MLLLLLLLPASPGLELLPNSDEDEEGTAFDGGNSVIEELRSISDDEEPDGRAQAELAAPAGVGEDCIATSSSLSKGVRSLLWRRCFGGSSISMVVLGDNLVDL